MPTTADTTLRPTFLVNIEPRLNTSLVPDSTIEDVDTLRIRHSIPVDSCCLTRFRSQVRLVGSTLRLDLVTTDTFVNGSPHWLRLRLAIPRDSLAGLLQAVEYVIHGNDTLAIDTFPLTTRFPVAQSRPVVAASTLYLEGNAGPNGLSLLDGTGGTLRIQGIYGGGGWHSTLEPTTIVSYRDSLVRILIRDPGGKTTANWTRTAFATTIAGLAPGFRRVQVQALLEGVIVPVVDTMVTVESAP